MRPTSLVVALVAAFVTTGAAAQYQASRRHRDSILPEEPVCRGGYYDNSPRHPHQRDRAGQAAGVESTPRINAAAPPSSPQLRPQGQHRR